MAEAIQILHERGESDHRAGSRKTGGLFGPDDSQARALVCANLLRAIYASVAPRGPLLFQGRGRGVADGSRPSSRVTSMWKGFKSALRSNTPILSGRVTKR